MVYEEVMDYLKLNGKNIGEEANNGNEKALEVMKRYKLHYTCSGDPGGKAFLISSVEDYIESEK